MPRYDADRMLKLVSQMREALGNLQRLKDYKKSVFISDPDKIGSAKYNFIMAIEAAIDMCNHIISRNGYRAPEDYADTFTVLGEKGAFEKSFVNDLKEMAKFRNRLVHIYWEIDENQIYDILLTRLGDFKKLLNQLAKFLDWSEIP
ncbi:MAG: DUF86 domain-containing protein [Candidatus Aminicenantes bacterium]